MAKKAQAALVKKESSGKLTAKQKQGRFGTNLSNTVELR